MFNLQAMLPCKRISRVRQNRIDKETSTETVIMDIKKRELHSVAKEFEETVKEFLSDKDNLGVARNDR